MFSKDETLRTLHQKGLLENGASLTTQIIKNLNICRKSIDMSIYYAADRTFVRIATAELSSVFYRIEYLWNDKDEVIDTAYTLDNQPLIWENDREEDVWSESRMTRADVEDLLMEIKAASRLGKRRSKSTYS